MYVTLCVFSGFTTATVNATLADPSIKEPLPSTPIDPPTLAMAFGANSSPFAGRYERTHARTHARTHDSPLSLLLLLSLLFSLSLDTP